MSEKKVGDVKMLRLFDGSRVEIGDKYGTLALNDKEKDRVTIVDSISRCYPSNGIEGFNFLADNGEIIATYNERCIVAIYFYVSVDFDESESEVAESEA